MLSQEFETNLRAALDEVAARVPEHVGHRLRERAYHPRGPRRVLGVGVAAAVLATAVVVALVANSMGSTAGPRSGHGVNMSWKLVSYLGSGWRLPASKGFQGGVGFTCPTTSTCYAVEPDVSATGPSWIEVTRDGGATWHRSMLPGRTTPNANAISCENATSCAMVVQSSGGEFEFITTRDGARSWAVHRGPSGLQWNFVFSGLACATGTSCVALGSTGSSNSRAYVTSDGWQTWSRSTLPRSFNPAWVRCFADGRCVATSSGGLAEPMYGSLAYSTDSGASWTYANVPAGIFPFSGLGSLSCGDALHCVTTGLTRSSRSYASVVLATSDGGQNWTRAAGRGLPDGGGFGPISCGDGSHCWAAGLMAAPHQPGSGTGGGLSPLDRVPVLVSTADQGQTWQPTQLPKSLHIGGVWSVSCPDASTCFAIVFTSTKAGTRATTPVLLSYGR